MSEENEVRMKVPYFQVPNKIFDVEEIGKCEKLVYMYLARCSNQGSKAFPSYKTIAEKCSMSRRKAIDSVKKLKELELVEKQERKYKPDMNKTNLYWINTPSECDALGGECHALGSESDALNDKELYDEELIDKELKHNVRLPSHGKWFEEYREAYFNCIGENHPPIPQHSLNRIREQIESFQDMFDVNRKQIRTTAEYYLYEELEEIEYKREANMALFVKKFRRMADEAGVYLS